MELLRHKAPQIRVDFLVHQRAGHISGTASFDAEILERGARLMPILTPSQSGVRRYLRSFGSYVKAYGRPDVIHIHLNARSGLVVLAARLHNIPRIIVHSHAALTFRGSLLYRALANTELALSKVLFSAFATDYWGCSREALGSLFARWPHRGQPRVVISNAIDLDAYGVVAHDAIARLRIALSGGRRELLIGTVGRVVRHKNAAFLVHVLAELRSRGLPVALVVVGREEDEGYCTEIRLRATQAGISEHVRWVGERSDIPNVMAAFDVFVSPALREGFGLVALEAQAAGTPSVLSSGFPSSIDMEVGLVRRVSGFDPSIWANAVEDAVLSQRPAREVIAEAITAKGFSARENTLRIERALRDPSFLPGEEV
jgi:glycosyltransferase EpsF